MDKCLKCDGTGWVTVSYADPENGPTADPADEQGTEPCECPEGERALHEYNEKLERDNAEHFARMERGEVD